MPAPSANWQSGSSNQPSYGGHVRPGMNSALGGTPGTQAAVDWVEEMNRIRWEQLVERGMVEGHDEQRQDEDIQRIARDMVQGDLEGRAGGGGGPGGGGFDVPPGAPGAGMPARVDTSRLAAMGNYSPPPLPTAPTWGPAAEKPASIPQFDPSSLGAPAPLAAAPGAPERGDPGQFGRPGQMPNLRRPQHPPRPMPPRV